MRRSQIVNEEQVSALIARHELAVVDFGSLSVAKQVAAALDARVMAGPHGAAFVHCQLMRTRSRLIEMFSPHYVNNTTSASVERSSTTTDNWSRRTRGGSPMSTVRIIHHCVHLDLALRG